MRRIRPDPAPIRRRGPAAARRARQRACLLLVLVTVAGCSRRAEPVPAPNPTADRRIQSEVQARLAAEPSLREEIVRVEVEGARVRLLGTVQGIGAWHCALRNAWLVAGVEGVNDFLVLERGPREVRCLAVRG